MRTKTEAAAQLRGHCQCCAGLWATTGAGMSHHGYKVKKDGGYAWFSGTCPGLQHPPIEVARDVADGTVKWLRSEAEAATRRAAALRDGSLTPATAKGGWDSKAREYATVAWDDAKPWERRDALKTAIFQAEQRARYAASDAEHLSNLIERVHGKPLTEVRRAEKAAPIKPGEKRQSDGGVLTAAYVQGARVYWTKDRENGAKLKGWTGTQAWRRFPTAA